jgi:hypothetical protein
LIKSLRVLTNSYPPQMMFLHQRSLNKKTSVNQFPYYRHFRAKLRKESSSKFGAKDALTLAISVAALVVSAVTLYFNAIRQVEDLSVLVSDIPTVRVLDKKQMSLSGEMVFTLVNLGTRPAALLRADILVMAPAGEKKCQGNLDVGRDIGFRTDFVPTIVKGGEIAAKVVKPLYQTKNGKSDTRMTFPPVNKLGEYDSTTFEICVEFTLSTPSVTVESIRIYLGDYGSAPPQTYMSTENYVDLTKPISLRYATNEPFDFLRFSLREKVATSDQPVP